jgi:hypothetical protein
MFALREQRVLTRVKQAQPGTRSSSAENRSNIYSVILSGEESGFFLTVQSIDSKNLGAAIFK